MTDIPGRSRLHAQSSLGPPFALSLQHLDRMSQCIGPSVHQATAPAVQLCMLTALSCSRHDVEDKGEAQRVSARSGFSSENAGWAVLAGQPVVRVRTCSIFSSPRYQK